MEIARSKRLAEKKKLRALERKQQEHDDGLRDRYGTVTTMLAER
jgi:hypothetical protein